MPKHALVHSRQLPLLVIALSTSRHRQSRRPLILLVVGCAAAAAVELFDDVLAKSGHLRFTRTEGHANGGARERRGTRTEGHAQRGRGLSEHSV